MIIVDTALKKRLAKGIPCASAWSAPATWGGASRSRSSPRCRACASSRSPIATLSQAVRAYREAGVDDVTIGRQRRRSSRRDGRASATPSPTIRSRRSAGRASVEAIIETTGDVESGARWRSTR